jgi:DNA invertase Pin-like site-specific DNA recombinase
MTTTIRAAIYARVSTSDQTCENQLFIGASPLLRGSWLAGNRIRRYRRQRCERQATGARCFTEGCQAPTLRRVCWRLDRLGRDLRHLVTMLEDLNHVGVAFVSLGEGIDCTTPAGKLQLHILAALAEFERERIKEST